MGFHSLQWKMHCHENEPTGHGQEGSTGQRSSCTKHCDTMLLGAFTQHPYAKRTSEITAGAPISVGNIHSVSVVGLLCCLHSKSIQMNTQVHTKVNFQITCLNIHEVICSTVSNRGICAGRARAAIRAGRKGREKAATS